MRNYSKRLIPLLMLVGCTGHSQRAPKLGPLSLPEERVAGRGEWLDIGLAPVAYRHVGTDPQAGPWRILVSQLGHYCPVDDSTYVIVQDGTLFPCAWRAVRP